MMTTLAALKLRLKGPMLKVSAAAVASVLALSGNNLSGLAVEPKDLDRRTMFNGKKKKMKVEMDE